MKDFFIGIGETVLFKNQKAVITRIIDLNTISIELVERGIPYTVKIKEVSPVINDIDVKIKDFSTLTKEEWEEANRRFEIIKPLLNKKGKNKDINDIIKKHNVSQATIYRWIKSYKEFGLISSLANKERTGGKGKSRLTKEQDLLIKEAIELVYLSSSKGSIKKTIRKIRQSCLESDIKCPHENTIRNRIKSLSNELKLRKRYGNQEAMYKYEPHLGKFPGADFPLSIVQIDHTLLDIVLVDEEYRNPYKRPWITVAIDIYSRMVLGFYLSFESPGAHGTGLCISHAILPKDKWLERFGLNEIEWPCWGFMKTLHFDNAKEFRGTMLEKACIEYNINIEFRPPGKPHYGGHVERLLGTFAKDIHDLPGTTFDTIKKRKNYNSKDKASLTLNEFEKWLTLYITKVYHLKKHSSIGMSPLQKYKEGVFGNEENIGVGLPAISKNERKLKLDFMPYVERTIQEYGVVIDHVFYYEDVLKKYVHSMSEKKSKEKRKFLFRRDPRDISKVYFFDPELKDYFDIPYRNTSLPPISIWEFKDVVRTLNRKKIMLNEDIIFDTYKELDEIADRSMRETREQKRKSIKPSDYKQKENEDSIVPFIDAKDIIPFDDDE